MSHRYSRVRRPWRGLPYWALWFASLEALAAPTPGTMIDGTPTIEGQMRARVIEAIEASRLQGRPRPGAEAGIATGRCVAAAEPADTEVFNVFDLTDFDVFSGLDVSCVKVAESKHAYIYVEKSRWQSSLIDQKVINFFVDLLDVATPAVADGRQVVPSIAPELGTLDIVTRELGVPIPGPSDADDVDGLDKIFFVFVDIPDSYARTRTAVNGYFSSVNQMCADEFSRSFPAEFGRGLRSNEKEMLVLDIDPSLGPSFRDRVNGVPAHEFQHLLHWFQDEREGIWVDEGLADLCAELVGYPATGHYDAFLANHDKNSMAYWEQTQEDYGHAGLFFRYLADHPEVGNAQRWANMDAIRAIFASSRRSVNGVDAGLVEAGEARTLGELYSDFSVAMLLRDPEFEGGRYGMPAGGPSLAPPPNSFTDLELSGIVGEDGAEVSDRVTGYTARFCRLESFVADSIFVGITGPAGLSGRAILGFDGPRADPLALTPLEVLDLPPVAPEGSGFRYEAAMEDVGIRGNRVVVVTSYQDRIPPYKGEVGYSVFASGSAAEAGDCLSTVQVRPTRIQPSRGANYDWPVRFFLGEVAPPDARVAVYDAGGFPVRFLDSGQSEWDGTNDAGENLAGGIYHWVIVCEGTTRRGTIVVIR